MMHALHQAGKSLRAWLGESFNGMLWDEFLNRELFDTVLEAKVPADHYRKQVQAR